MTQDVVHVQNVLVASIVENQTIPVLICQSVQNVTQITSTIHKKAMKTCGMNALKDQAPPMDAVVNSAAVVIIPVDIKIQGTEVALCAMNATILI